jgi:hypothetical protein
MRRSEDGTAEGAPVPHQRIDVARNIDSAVEISLKKRVQGHGLAGITGRKLFVVKNDMFRQRRHVQIPIPRSRHLRPFLPEYQRKSALRAAALVALNGAY